MERRGRIALPPMVPADPVPDLALALGSQLEIQPTTRPLATTERSMFAGLERFFAMCSWNAALVPSRERRHLVPLGLRLVHEQYRQVVVGDLPELDGRLAHPSIMPRRRAPTPSG